MSLSKRHSFIHLIPLAVILILFTCQKQVFDNPHDETSVADPSSSGSYQDLPGAGIVKLDFLDFQRPVYFP